MSEALPRNRPAGTKKPSEDLRRLSGSTALRESCFVINVLWTAYSKKCTEVDKTYTMITYFDILEHIQGRGLPSKKEAESIIEKSRDKSFWNCDEDDNLVKLQGSIDVLYNCIPGNE